MSDRASPHVAVVGAGPAGLMAAEVAARAGCDVTIYDRMASPGRKLLLAGRGGLNLTHSEDPARFLARYGEAAACLAPALDRFGATELRAWCAGLGIETFVGTSGRVFPVGLKTSPLLRGWLRRLDAAGVGFKLRHRWVGWAAGGALMFETPDGTFHARAGATILALGGASWPHLGPDGRWVETLAAETLDIAPLGPANCGFLVPWSEAFRARAEGQPLKSVALAFAGQTARGDLVVTRQGLEGGPIYALAGALREAIARDGEAKIHVALRPDMSADAIAARLGKRRPKESLANVLRKTLHLSPVAIGLLREAELAPGTTLATFDAEGLAHLINAVPVRLTAPMPIARAISTAGGVRFAGLDAGLMLARRPGTFVAGEMLDWEAPTGGYLLQACFATGALAGEAAARWLHGQGASKVEADVGAPLVV